ncbi:MAG: hypothetical protein R3F56_08190 [Planctomycetota bacterium]
MDTAHRASHALEVAPHPASRLWSLVAALGAGTLAAAVARTRRGVTYDDAMIAARYARNLIEGKGWTYNPMAAESVNASTSPLSTLAHALAGMACGGDLLLGQVVVCAASIAVAGFATSRLVADAGRVPALSAALLAACIPLLYAALGLESALFVALALSTCALWRRALDRPGYEFGAAAALGLTALTRPEGLLLGVVLGTAAAWRHGRARGATFVLFRLLWLVATSLLVMLPWLVYAHHRFGSVLPHTLAAKIAQGRSGWWGAGDGLFVRGMKHSLSMFDARGFGAGYKPIAVVAGLGVLAAARWVWPLLVPIAFAALHVTALAALGVPYYPWYAAALHTGTMLGALALGVAAWTAGQTWRLLALAWWALVGALAFPGWWTHREDPYAHYRAAADWLQQESPPAASIACAEIGVLGFGVGDRTIVDMCGLVTPDGVDPIAHGDLDWWLDAHHPDFIVVHDPPWPGFEARALARADFGALYEQATIIGASDILRIYRRR